MFWLIWLMLGLLYFCSNLIYIIIMYEDGMLFDKKWQNVLLTIVMLFFGTPIVIVYIIAGIIYIIVQAIKERKERVHGKEKN